jgi:misacylated tRNA(Ala) deacylase
VGAAVGTGIWRDVTVEDGTATGVGGDGGVLACSGPAANDARPRNVRQPTTSTPNRNIVPAVVRDARPFSASQATRGRATNRYHLAVSETEQLYSTDAYVRAFDATVAEVTPEGWLILDRTAFYPTGGGQPHDLGTLTWEGGSASVLEVRKAGGQVVHRLEGQAPPVGSSVHGDIDWERRYALMRHHTALHSMSGVIYQLYGSTVTGGQMYPDRARMDFLLPDLSQERLQSIEERTNELLVEGHPVSIRFLARDEAFQIPDLIRTRVNLLPEGIDIIRVVNIEGIDQQADGGTHVANTREVGRVRIVGSENKGKGNKRLEIVLE